MNYYSFFRGHHLNILYHKFDLKNQLLLFDKVAISDIEGVLCELDGIKDTKYYYPHEKMYLAKFYTELKELYDLNLILDPFKDIIKPDNLLNLDKFKNDDDLNKYLIELSETIKKKDENDELANTTIDYLESVKFQHELAKNKPFTSEFYQAIVDGDILYTKLFSIVLNDFNKSDCFIPIISSNGYRPNCNLADMLKVTLNKIPIITNENNIEKIIEYKNNSKSILTFSKFKNWLIDLEKKNLSENEFEQKLEYYIYEYEDNLKLNKIKYNLSFFETIVSFSLPILENAIKLRFSKVAETLFSLKKKKVEMLESEKKLLGNEVAYLVNIKGGFDM